MQTFLNWIRKIAEWFLKRIFGLIHKELKDSAVDAFMQFVRFGLVGISNTIVSYVIYIAVLLLMQKAGWLPESDYIIANIAAFVLSVLWSFYWNNKYVFTQEESGEKRSVWKTLLKTYMSYAFTGLILTNVLSVLWIQVLHISKVVAPLINLIITVPLNFIMNKFWAFRKSEKR